MLFGRPPPCTSFSVASIGKHWYSDHTPKTKQAEEGLIILAHTIELLSLTNVGTIWFIENPRGKMRKVIDALFVKCGILNVKRHTVTYCQYGDTRMKPTDIWTNCDIQFKSPCKNGDNCHEPAPRGSRTGTQGIKGAINRGVIPAPLMLDVIIYCEQLLKCNG